MSETIKNIPLEERPRERCIKHGADCLSIRELLALIIGSGPRGKGCLGLAEEIVLRGCGPSGSVRKSTSEDDDLMIFRRMRDDGGPLLTDIKGLGAASKARLLATFDFARRYSIFIENHSAEKKPSKRSLSKLKNLAAKEIPARLSRSRKEWVGFIPVYSSYRVGEICMVEWGTRFHTNFDPKSLFSKLFQLGAPGFFLVHNHPSDLQEASEADYALTQQIQLLGRQLNTHLIDHGIVSTQALTWLGGG